MRIVLDGRAVAMWGLLRTVTRPIYSRETACQVFEQSTRPVEKTIIQIVRMTRLLFGSV